MMTDAEFEQAYGRYRLPGGGWNWAAMPLEAYKAVDSWDRKDMPISIGAGEPTDYMPAEQRMKNENEATGYEQWTINRGTWRRIRRQLNPGPVPVALRPIIPRRRKLPLDKG